jgi:hypothetical protein
MLTAGGLMGRARPWTGYGPGTVSLVYPRYRAELSGGVDDVLQLHNTPVQFWAELGLPGVAALVLLLIGILKLATSGRPSAPGGLGIWPLLPDTGGTPVPLPDRAHPAERLYPLAVTVSCAGYAVVSLFDYQLDVPLFAAVIAALLVLWRLSAVARRNAVTGPIISLGVARLLGGLLLAALAAMLWPTLPELRAHQLFAAAAEARAAGDDSAFIAGAERAATVAPWDTFCLTQLAAFYGERFLRAGDAASQAQARAQCCALLRRALAVNPDREYCHFNLGWLLLPEDPAAAETHFRAAARFSPYRGGLYLGVGFSRLARNNRSAAANAFALEWLNDPQALASPVWDAPSLAPFRGEVVAAVRRVSRRWLDSGALPAAVQDQLRYVAALADWWTGGSADAAALVRHGSAEQRWFFTHLEGLEAHAYTPARGRAPQPWEQFYLAWRDGTAPAGLENETPEVAAAIRRRIARPHTSLANLLTASPGGDTALVRFIRNQRPGDSVLQRNQDGFLLSDLYIFPENVLVAKYVSFLFPPKGYLSSQLLLQTLDESAPATR